MRAVVLHSPEGSFKDLSLIQLAIPAPDLGQVLLRVRYASLNPVDYKLIAAKPSFWQYPYIPGLDLVGEVVKLGNPAKSKFCVGDIVALHGNLTYGGALAEYCVQPEHVLFKIPPNFDIALAAALPCAGLTAYQALVRKMNIQAGRSIFIQGGSGGVGSFAILIAKALGLQVISSCSTKNLDYVSSLGADIVLDYTQGDIYVKLRELCPRGVDYILETTNRENLQRDPSVLAFNGQIASIIGILDAREIPEFSSGIGFHEVALGGAYLSDHYPSQCDLALMGDELVELMHKSKIIPAIREYPLAEFAQAFADLQKNSYPGKIVINCTTYTRSI